MWSRRGLCLVLSAPSGGGKSSVARALLGDGGIALSVSATTRAPRPGERDGEHYHFRDAAAFAAMVERGEFLEHAEVFGRRYGTPRAPVEAALDAGRDVLFDVDWQGHAQLRAALPGDVVGVFLLPPSLAELERRLVARGGDGGEEIARRMAAARAEIERHAAFDYVVLNRELDATIAAVRGVLAAERARLARQTGLGAFVDDALRG